MTKREVVSNNVIYENNLRILNDKRRDKATIFETDCLFSESTPGFFLHIFPLVLSAG